MPERSGILHTGVFVKNLFERFIVSSHHHHSGPTRALNRTPAKNRPLYTSPGVWASPEEPQNDPEEQPLSVDSSPALKNGALGHVGRFGRGGGRKKIAGIPVSGDLNPDSALMSAPGYLGDSTSTLADRMIVECLSGQASMDEHELAMDPGTRRINQATIVWSDEKPTHRGVATGGTRPCLRAGCDGVRVAVRWKDGSKSNPCSSTLRPGAKNEWTVSGKHK